MFSSVFSGNFRFSHEHFDVSDPLTSPLACIFTNAPTNKTPRQNVAGCRENTELLMTNVGSEIATNCQAE